MTYQKILVFESSAHMRSFETTMDTQGTFRCPSCRKHAVRATTVAHHTKVKHENVLHDVFVPAMPVLLCEACGAMSVDDQADIAVRSALRAQLEVLEAATIRECISTLGETQELLAERCGFAPASVSRWINGAIPSRLSDRMLRLYFGVPEVREFLASLSANPNLGTEVVWISQAANQIAWPAEISGGSKGGMPLLWYGGTEQKEEWELAA